MPEKTAQLLANRYRLADPIARGGMAIVWRARDERLDRQVAVKILHTRLASDESFRERFRREAVAAASFNHPNIVTVFDTGEEDDTHFIVMELVDGTSLSRLIGPSGRLTPQEVVTVLRSVLAALEYSHERGVVHRDIKPANILLAPRPAPGVVKVGDFGIARALAASDLTATGAIIGTASYLAPEQAEGKRVDHRADLYSLACVAYRCMTGRLPWMADSEVGVALARTLRPPDALRPLCPDAPRRLVQVVEAALARDPAARYQSASAMASAMGGLRGAPLAHERRQQDATKPAARRAKSSATPVSPAVGAVPAPVETPPPVGIHLGELPGAERESSAKPVPAHARRERTPTRPNLPSESRERRAESRERAARHGERMRRVRHVAIAVAAALIVAFVILITLPSGRDDPPPPSSTAGVSSQIEPAAVFAFDPPPGDGEEYSGGGSTADYRERAVDGDPSTAWRTERYNTRDFGNIKEGVGLGFDLGEPVAPGTVTVTVTPGTSFELRTSDTDADALDDWKVVPGSSHTDVKASSATGADEGSNQGRNGPKPGKGPKAGTDTGDVSVEGDGSQATVTIDTGSLRARYWLVWITRLAPDPEGRGDAGRTEIAEVAFGGG